MRSHGEAVEPRQCWKHSPAWVTGEVSTVTNYPHHTAPFVKDTARSSQAVVNPETGEVLGRVSNHSFLTERLTDPAPIPHEDFWDRVAAMPLRTGAELKYDQLVRGLNRYDVFPEAEPQPDHEPARIRCKARRGCRLRKGHAGSCARRVGPSVDTTGPLGALPVRRQTGGDARTSLVTTHIQQSTQTDPEICPQAVWMWERCPTTKSYKRTVAPCGRWGCEPCRKARLSNELSPEIQANMKRAGGAGRMLKLLTLTFTAEEPAGENSGEGQRLRMLELQHFIQWGRRKYGRVEYLRVAETHKSGRVHLHLLIDIPYIPQRELQSQWGRRVFIEAIFVRCEKCWPGREGSDAAKARARVMRQADGVWRCRNGHTANRDLAHRRFAISAAWEIGKYMSKQSDVGRMSRSRNWIKAVPPMPEETGHEFDFGGPAVGLVTDPATQDQLSVVLQAMSVVWITPGVEPCDHWGEGVDHVPIGSQSISDVWIARGAP